MTPQHHLPADIERTSLSIITAELAELGLTPPPETAAVVKRVIHTTADFDYARNLHFTPRCRSGRGEGPAGGHSHHHRHEHGAGRHHQARPCPPGRHGPCATWLTRRWPPLPKQAAPPGRWLPCSRPRREHPGAVLAVGNAPTALLTIADQIEAGLRPALVIGVPVLCPATCPVPRRRGTSSMTFMPMAEPRS